MKPWMRYVLVAGGVAAAGAGAAYAYRRRRELLGVTEAPIVGQTSAGGMVMTHRRSANMPIEQRVRTIQNMVYKSANDPRIRKIALQITRHCPERDGMCEARAVYDFVKANIRYTGDIAPIKLGADGPVEGIDLYQSAWRTLDFGGGDCDDHSILVSSLLSHNGIPAQLRVTAVSKFADDSHIYPVAGLPKTGPGKWVPLDTTLPGNKFGYQVPYGRKRDFPA